MTRVKHHCVHFRQKKKSKEKKLIVNSLLSGSFLIKVSSLSAPTKIEELTAGSDEKTQRSPAGIRAQGLAISSGTHWPLQLSYELRVNSRFFVWSGCQFFYPCRMWKRGEFDELMTNVKLQHNIAASSLPPWLNPTLLLRDRSTHRWTRFTLENFFHWTLLVCK